MFLDFHFVKVGDLALNGLYRFGLVDTADMQIDNDTVFQVQNVRKHTVVQFRRKDFKEAHRAKFAPNAERASLTETERGRGDKVLCGKPGRDKPVPRETERLALRVENAMQHFQAFIARHGAGRYPKHLEIVEYVGFDTGKAGFCRRKVIRFNGKGDVLAFHKPVVALCKLIFQHIPVFDTDRVESVLLRRDLDSVLGFLAAPALIDERKLHLYGSVKVVEKIAPIFKNGGLFVCLCKLIVNVLKGDGLTVPLAGHMADTVRVHLHIGDCLLCGVGLPVALCFLYHFRDLLLFGAGQFTLCPGCGAFCLFCLLQWLLPPFQVFSAVR